MEVDGSSASHLSSTTAEATSPDSKFAKGEDNLPLASGVESASAPATPATGSSKPGREARHAVKPKKESLVPDSPAHHHRGTKTETAGASKMRTGVALGGWVKSQRDRLRSSVLILGYGRWLDIQKSANLTTKSEEEIQCMGESLIHMLDLIHLRYGSADESGNLDGANGTAVLGGMRTGASAATLASASSPPVAASTAGSIIKAIAPGSSSHGVPFPPSTSAFMDDDHPAEKRRRVGAGGSASTQHAPVPEVPFHVTVLEDTATAVVPGMGGSGGASLSDEAVWNCQVIPQVAYPSQSVTIRVMPPSGTLLDAFTEANTTALLQVIVYFDHDSAGELHHLQPTPPGTDASAKTSLPSAAPSDSAPTAKTTWIVRRLQLTQDQIRAASGVVTFHAPGFIGGYSVHAFLMPKGATLPRKPVVARGACVIASHEFRVAAHGVFLEPEFVEMVRRAYRGWTKKCMLLRMLNHVMQHYGANLQRLRDNVVPTQTSSKAPTVWWTDGMDRDLLISVYRYGYGRYDEIRKDNAFSISDENLSALAKAVSNIEGPGSSSADIIRFPAVTVLNKRLPRLVATLHQTLPGVQRPPKNKAESVRSVDLHAIPHHAHLQRHLPHPHKLHALLSQKLPTTSTHLHAGHAAVIPLISSVVASSTPSTSDLHSDSTLPPAPAPSSGLTVGLSSAVNDNNALALLMASHTSHQ